MDDGVTGGLVGLLIGAVVIVAVQFIRYRVWLYRFRRDWRREREQWFKEHQWCCELDESYLNQPYG